MSDRQLQHQLRELQSVTRAPVLWREQTRERLLQKIQSSSAQPYTLVERMVFYSQQVRLVLAPMHLAPVVVAFFIMLAGYAPFTSALAGSLPGNPLYPLKRSVEKFELSLRSSSDSQGIFYLTLAGRRLAEAKVVSDDALQAELLRDYNISLGFAAASLETGLPSGELAKAYDQATDFLSANLNTLSPAPVNRQVYKAALALTNKVSSRALALLVSQHAAKADSFKGDDVASRLNTEIAKMEAKLEVVEVKVNELPATKPAPRVVLGRAATVVPVKEAQALAKENLTEARELIARKEFTLALEKMQETEDLTTKSEAAVETEDATTTPEPVTPIEGEVKGEVSAPTSEVPAEKVTPQPEAGGAGETSEDKKTTSIVE